MRALSALRRWLAQSGTGLRAALALGFLVVLGVVASLVQGDTDRARTAVAPALGDLLSDGDAGRVVVDREGRPVRGPDGRQLRVARDGRTLLDSRGAVVRDRRGRPLRLGPSNTLPRALTPPRKRGGDRRRPGPRRARPRRGERRPGAEARAPAPITVGVTFPDEETARRNQEWLAQYGSETSIYQGPGIRAVVEHVNRTGGVAGRRLVLQPYEYTATTTTSGDQLATEACERFRGSRPDVVVGPAFDARVAPCLKEAGIPLISSWVHQGSRAFFAAHASHFFAPGGLALDRVGEPLIRGLKGAGFFAGADVRAGLLRFDGFGMHEGAEALKAALARAGVSTVEKKIPLGDSLDDMSATLSHVRVAVAEFRAKGVTHVLAIDPEGVGIGFFMIYAESEGWVPKYGLNSTNAPNALWEYELLLGKSLSRAIGVGWAPLVDVDQDPERPSGHRAECAEIFRSRGVNTGGRHPHAQHRAYAHCDGLLMLRAAVERSGDASAAGIRAGMESLGASRTSAVALKTWLGPQRNDGAADMRLFRYRGDRFVYDRAGDRASARSPREWIPSLP